MKRDKIFSLSESELEALSAKQLLARLKRLHQCKESLALSDRESSDGSGCIEFKQSIEWIAAYEKVKQILYRREHVPKGDELVRRRVARAHRATNSDRKAGRYVSTRRV
jgi:hypothetical protein